MSIHIEGRIGNRAETAKTFGISAVTLDAWVSAGCPFVERGSKGKEWKFDSAAVFRWREQRVAEAAIGDGAAMDLNEAKRRKTVAEAMLLEIERDIKLKTVVLVDDVVAIIAKEYSLVRNRLLCIPSKLAVRLSQARLGPPEVQAAIMKEVSLALAELSGPEELAAATAA